MRYYLLPDLEDYKVVKVQDEDIPLFQKRYTASILFEADSLTELLAQFSAFVENLTNESG